MRQTKLVLKPEDREKLQVFRSKGLHLAREINRAHILLALDRNIPEVTIQTLLGVGRTAVWRTRSAYCERGLDYALYVLRILQPEAGIRWKKLGLEGLQRTISDRRRCGTMEELFL